MKLARSDGLGSPARKPRLSFLTPLVAALSVFFALGSFAPSAGAQEPAACLSPNPADWPDPSKPYFMIAFDTSGSMTDTTGSASSCGFGDRRIDHGRCAIRNTLLAFSEVNLGLASFAREMFGCSGVACPVQDQNTAAETFGCQWRNLAGNSAAANCGAGDGCGAEPNPGAGNSSSRAGANILVPMWRDNYWDAVRDPSNTNQLLSWVDNNCTNSQELFANGCTPLNGMLRDMLRYFQTGWTRPGGGASFPTPLSTNDRPCRLVNVILVTDGDETCDTQADAVDAAADLYNIGAQIGPTLFRIRTHVINFAGGTAANANAIADAGDDGIPNNGSAQARFANNEAQLSAALANIIAGSLRPEVCNNVDDNCNGCTDEGYKHYCNTRTQCCAWTTPQQRQSCISTFLSSKNPNALPCTTPQQRDQPANWLCYDPGEVCDDADNNCNGQVDEGFTKCGTPAACPAQETCNGRDDDCDSILDNAPGSGVPFSMCPDQCAPTPEVCDGCDNDCDGIADDGIAPIPCGFSPPPNCIGQKTCPPQPVAFAGGCVPGGATYGPCNNNPTAEVCDNLDNDCNGIINNGVPPTPCDIPGQPGIVYQDTNPTSICKRGQLPCNGTCAGWVGPAPEVCDGKDNDCDGQVDEGLTGLGQPCGTDAGSCSKGTTACIGGAIVCAGGTPPEPEVCNGIDDDCDGVTDDGPLDDAPAAPGCWNGDPSTCANVCIYSNFRWCPPAGATCASRGTLAAPCAPGALTCNGTSGWTCRGATLPEPEVCDSVDNNCNGQLNEGLGPPIGQSCGPAAVGQCKPGMNVCDNGTIVCQGAQGPVPEVCNGLDDNCNGTVDEGVPVGGPCAATYDKTQYPGPDRSGGECKPGTSVCPMGAGPTCIGGVGPKPEVCDGKDNDCDGQVDETGTPPDGIDGSVDPFDATRRLGTPCGPDVGECVHGLWECRTGRFVCVGAITAQPEKCDCLDNDCDGETDEEPDLDAGDLPLCEEGKKCVRTAGGGEDCQCAKPCGGGEFPCQLPTTCQTVVESNSGQPPAGGARYCMDPGTCAQDCTKVTHVEQGVLECAPPGTFNDAGQPVPQCECNRRLGCRSPCADKNCPAGQQCVPQGPAKGTCQPPGNCNYFGCASGKVCHDSACVDDPCEPNPCPPNEVCKPTADFSSSRCTGSCAAQSCGAADECVDGSCTPTGCPQPCQPGEVCQNRDGGNICWADLCAGDAGVHCTEGRYCNPETGTCGDDPCTAIKCPAGQVCKAGECYFGSTDGGSTGGQGGTTTDAGIQGAGGTSGTTTRPAAEQRGVFGLASGGGCGCRAAGGRTPLAFGLLSLLMAVGIGRRRARARVARLGGEK